MSTIFLFVSICLVACSINSISNTDTKVAEAPKLAEVSISVETPKPVERATIISETEFKKLVMDYETNPEQWIYKGKLPSIISFYADWCAPCRRMVPTLDELAREYAGKVNIYRVNVDHSQHLSGFFGIRSLPTLLFCPVGRNPAIQPGMMSKEQLVHAIENFLLRSE